MDDCVQPAPAEKREFDKDAFVRMNVVQVLAAMIVRGGDRARDIPDAIHCTVELYYALRDRGYLPRKG